MGHIIYGIVIFYGSLLLGYTFKKVGILKEALAQRITGLIIRFVSPTILALSFWNLKFSNLRILTLPLVGMGISAMCILPAFIFVRNFKFDAPKTGSFLICALFSNVGYPLGAFLCFILFGELGFGLAIVYCLYWSAFFYTAGFYIASRYGSGRGYGFKESGEELKTFPMIGIVLGVLLNLFGVFRPAILSDINSILIPISTAGYLFSAGLTLRFSRLQRHIKPCLAVSSIKFLYAPLVGFALSIILGYGGIMDGLVLKVVLIESAMPVAISCMILPQIFELDQDLANSLWIFTTFLLVAILPILIFIIQFV